jgi:CRISPR-associated protein Cas1
MEKNVGRLKLVLNNFGISLGRKRNRYVIKNDEVRHEIVSSSVEQIHLLNPGISVSVSALRLALSNQTLVVLGNANGWPHGFITPAKLSGTVRGKREQFLAYHDFRGAFLAMKFASGKAFNQRNLLKLLSKNRTKTEPSIAEILNKASEEVEMLARTIMCITNNDNIDKIRSQVMNIEARASKIYWNAVSILFPLQLSFSGRKNRGASDPVNMMLNFGYKAILFVEAWKAIYYSGLDPYAGYLHADRAGKPSLVLDFMEEFRQHVVDRVLFSILNKKMLKIDNIMEFDETIKQHRLSKQAIQILVNQITQQLESKIVYNNGNCKMRNVIHNQARRVLRYLLSPSNGYCTFELLW